jgi:hypothetical protein
VADTVSASVEITDQAPHVVPGDADLRKANGDRGIYPTEDTQIPDWDGVRPNYALIIDHLLYVDGASMTSGPSHTSPTSPSKHVRRATKISEKYRLCERLLRRDAGDRLAGSGPPGATPRHLASSVRRALHKLWAPTEAPRRHSGPRWRGASWLRPVARDWRGFVQDMGDDITP